MSVSHSARAPVMPAAERSSDQASAAAARDTAVPSEAADPSADAGLDTAVDACSPCNAAVGAPECNGVPFLSGLSVSVLSQTRFAHGID